MFLEILVLLRIRIKDKKNLRQQKLRISLISILEIGIEKDLKKIKSCNFKSFWKKRRNFHHFPICCDKIFHTWPPWRKCPRSLCWLRSYCPLVYWRPPSGLRWQPPSSPRSCRVMIWRTWHVFRVKTIYSGYRD